jgi:PHD/YefM family antitoxin component YafN of YafNO toxin-antitoxin module
VTFVNYEGDFVFSTQIRPVTDLRNRYSDVEGDLANGPVVLTKNGYGASVLVSIDMFDRLIKKQELYEAISRSESEIDAGLGVDAMSSLSKMRATLNV